MTRANNPPIALITGAARRIGAQVARTLHSSGFDVVIHYRRSEAEARALCAELNQVRPDSARPIGSDLTHARGCRALIEQALAWHGRLDALVNNASSFSRTPIGDIDEDQWAELLDGNLKAAFFCSQYAAPALKASRGAIVNVCDVHTERPLPQFSVYTAAKAGIVSLTRSFALELAPDVRVNAVSPGSLTWPEDAIFSDTERVRIESSIPLARIGDGLDIGVAVRFLLHEAHYVTGQVLAVDGGAGIVSS